MALQTHKIALRTNDKHESWFCSQSGYARFAFNSALADFKEGLSTGEFRSFIDLNNRFNKRKKAYEWTEAQDQRAALYGIRNLCDGIQRWVDKQNRFPKFKKRGSRQSYTLEGVLVRVEGKRIRLPKIGWIGMFQALRFEGEIKLVTISRTARRWFVSITVHTGTPKNPRDTRGLPVVGVDVGINTLATLDDGRHYPNPKPLKRYERKLKREQRRLSKKTFLSNNYYKQKRKVERLHYKVACIRKDAQHKATTDILSNASAIGIETLKIANLLKNRNIARALSDSALGGFLERLKSKADLLGIPVIEAPQFFASSKTCSHCGHKKAELSLSERTYHCDKCNYQTDRDINAAMNLKHLAVGHAESLNACGV